MKALITLVALVLLSAGCDDSTKLRLRPPWPPDRSGYTNPIPGENQQPGDSNLFDGREVQANEIEGYASRSSAKAGQTVDVMVSSDSPHQATWSLYRLGWYGGNRARRVLEGGNFEVRRQTACPTERDTGLVRCRWTPSFSFQVKSEHPSGLYVIKLARDDRYTSYVPLVITDDRPADILFQASTDTYQAYNAWQGQSLYDDASGNVQGGMAIKVSYDRPYASDRGTGQLMRYEAHMAAFLERYGYDVTYTANGEVSARGESLLSSRGLFLSVGHDEYWPPSIRDAVEKARNVGVPVLFFGANAAYWKTRYEDAADPTNPRVITCYKNYPENDPDQGAGRTGRYRDEPLNRPENALVGTMYESYQLISGPWTVADPTHFIYEGTGLTKGDTIPFLVGYEYDRVVDNGAAPKGLSIVAHSPVVDANGRPSWSDAVVYRAESGALVFGAGTIEWSYGLGRPGVADVRVERMTANLLKEALPAALSIPPPLADTLVLNGPNFPRPSSKPSVSTVARGLQGAAAVAPLPNGAFVIADATTHQVFQAGPSANDPLTLIAGDGRYSRKDEYDNVPGPKARFAFPTGIAVLPSGEIIVSDTANHCLRKIGTDSNRTVTTVAGTRGKAGYKDGVGVTATFRNPMGLALDPITGDLLVADSGNGRIRRVNTLTWTVTTEAGAGHGQTEGPARVARFTYPSAVAMANDGRIFVVSSGDYRIVMVGTDLDRTTVTIAGGKRGYDDGSGATATLAPQGGAAWTGSALIVSEPAINRLRRIIPGTNAATTRVEVLAGASTFGDADGTGDVAQFASPLGLALDPGGKLLVANGGNGSVKGVSF